LTIPAAKEWSMNTGQTVFSQLLEFFPYYEFTKCVKRYDGEYKVKNFSCLDQFIAMAFAQVTLRESLPALQVQTPAYFLA
jgi:hypothetical protein